MVGMYAKKYRYHKRKRDHLTLTLDFTCGFHIESVQLLSRVDTSLILIRFNWELYTAKIEVFGFRDELVVIPPYELCAFGWLLKHSFRMCQHVLTQHQLRQQL